jgi:signal transduction histidine kinase
MSVDLHGPGLWYVTRATGLVALLLLTASVLLGLLNAGAWFVVSDDGPGFPPGGPVRRGLSGAGSTGLGLDIARRLAEESGGTMTIGQSPSGGGRVALSLGGPPGAGEPRRRWRGRSR